MTDIGSIAAGRIPGYTAEQYIRESIVDSCAYDGSKISGLPSCDLMANVMNTLELSREDIDSLVAFLLQQK